LLLSYAADVFKKVLKWRVGTFPWGRTGKGGRHAEWHFGIGGFVRCPGSDLGHGAGGIKTLRLAAGAL